MQIGSADISRVAVACVPVTVRICLEQRSQPPNQAEGTILQNSLCSSVITNRDPEKHTRTSAPPPRRERDEGVVGVCFRVLLKRPQAVSMYRGAHMYSSGDNRQGQGSSWVTLNTNCRQPSRRWEPWCSRAVPSQPAPPIRLEPLDRQPQGLRACNKLGRTLKVL